MHSLHVRREADCSGPSTRHGIVRSACAALLALPWELATGRAMSLSIAWRRWSHPVSRCALCREGFWRTMRTARSALSTIRRWRRLQPHEAGSLGSDGFESRIHLPSVCRVATAVASFTLVQATPSSEPNRRRRALAAPQRLPGTASPPPSRTLDVGADQSSGTLRPLEIRSPQYPSSRRRAACFAPRPSPGPRTATTAQRRARTRPRTEHLSVGSRLPSSCTRPRTAYR